MPELPSRQADGPRLRDPFSKLQVYLHLAPKESDLAHARAVVGFTLAQLAAADLDLLVRARTVVDARSLCVWALATQSKAQEKALLAQLEVKLPGCSQSFPIS